jgi:glycosyltransferase involved in cell wall biosynthesis/SAM-dependent methyltransferase
MSPRRVLVVADVSPVRPAGGGERMLWEQASRLAARGWRVRVLCRSNADGAVERLERQGVSIEPFPVDRSSPARLTRTSILSARRATSEALAAEGADVLHLHQPLAAYGALLSPAGRRLPSVYSFHSPAPLEYRSRRGMTRHHLGGWPGGFGVAALWAIERACLARASLIHVLSDFSAGHLWKLYGVPAERIVKIPGAVALEQFCPAADRGAVRGTLDLPRARRVLLTVRNLEARMGLDALIRAMAILRSRMPDALLLIGGAGSLRPELEALSASLGLEAHVRFLGFISDAELPRYYQAADVFVLPTRELEGFGLVTVEALACGTPVLGTPVGATPEILAPLSPSLIFHGTAPETLADDLARFLEGQARDPGAAEQLRRACRRYAEAHYGWDREVDALAAALSRAVVGRAAAEDAPASCPACGGPTRRSGLRYRGARYRRCRRCRSSVVATLPTPLELQRSYETEYPRRFRPDRVTQGRSALFGALLSRLARLAGEAPAGSRLLDVGCGGGHLVLLAGRRGWRAFGTDVSRQACAVTNETAGSEAVQADGAWLPFREGSMGAVTLVNIVDQAGEPIAILRDAHRVLVPRGCLVVRVPNAAFHRPWVRFLTALGPFARSRDWDAYPILHHFAFAAPGLRQLVARAGFTILDLRNSPLDGGGAHRWWRVLIAGVAAAAALASAGRWLVGPSIELYARKEGG